MEWVDGQLIPKPDMTLRHGQVQSRLSFYWRGYMLSSGQGGEVFTEVSCRTQKQIRRPDLAYLTPELLQHYSDGNDGSVSSPTLPLVLPPVLPQSFPLIAEVASPDDKAEELLAKAAEYLQSGSEEVWLIFPETCWLMILMDDSHHLLTLGEVAQTQKVLLGFEVAVAELLSGFGVRAANGQGTA
jgi:Uma2 family endonuclease